MSTQFSSLPEPVVEDERVEFPDETGDEPHIRGSGQAKREVFSILEQLVIRSLQPRVEISPLRLLRRLQSR